MMNITPVVKQLLIINILFFIGSYFVPISYDLFALYYPENENFRIWQLITHMFMHNPFPNVSHILFNMFALYSFGSALEHFWGAKKFLFFYISCGLGASLLHILSNYYFYHEGLNMLLANGIQNSQIIEGMRGIDINQNTGKYFLQEPFQSNFVEILSQSGFDSFTSSIITPVVGASGAIYGLLIAFTFMFPNAELALMFIPIPIKAKYFVPIYMLLYDGFFGFFGNSFMGLSDGVAHFAHIGGALTGFIMMWYWKKNQFNDNRWN